jgi:hypothetical protein
VNWLSAMDAMTELRFVIELHSDGYLAYALGLKGMVLVREALPTTRSPMQYLLQNSTSIRLAQRSPIAADSWFLVARQLSPG